MNIQDIANEVSDAGDKIIRFGMHLLDEGRRIQDVSNDIRFERLHPNALPVTMREVDQLAYEAKDEIEDAGRMIARVPYRDVKYE